MRASSSGPLPLIAIIGGHSHNTTDEAVILAKAVGRTLGERGYGIVCGGGDGIMEAACEGVQSGGGFTVGILKSNRLHEANPWVQIALPTSLDVASNNLIIWAARAVIAFEGRYGTLNEIALALDFGKPLLALGACSLLNIPAVRGSAFRHLPHVTQRDSGHVVDVMEDMLIQMPLATPTFRER